MVLALASVAAVAAAAAVIAYVMMKPMWDADRRSADFLKRPRRGPGDLGNHSLGM